MIVISVIIGLVAVVLASRWVAQQTDVSTSQVVVAKTDINLGARLSPEMLAVQDWPAGSVPHGAIHGKNKDALLKEGATVITGTVTPGLDRAQQPRPGSAGPRMPF